MSSLIPGYEYDVFISYRQKDNKHDGWVTDFVELLKAELESTFKEEVSLYFDVNPHDGLLETHDVEASLKEKLKSIVFIPIISQTYCDPYSFAWEHEFKAFIGLASKDEHGLKIKLHNGNFANRVLPVRIHDLEVEDMQLCESLMGGQLRGIDFIYREPGVNRPLTPRDKEKNNLNNTLYRNQINKVANAIKEIIYGLKGIPVHTVEEKKLQGDSKGGKKSMEPVADSLPFPLKSKWLILISSILLCLAVAYGIFKLTTTYRQNQQFANLEKSIAVLPFENLSPGEEVPITCDGIAELVINDLQNVNEFNVRPGLALIKYKKEQVTVPELGRELKVSYVLIGYFVKSKNLILTVNLIRALDQKVVWTNRYDEAKLKDPYALLSDITTGIVFSLKTHLTGEEKKLIEQRPTKDPVVYANFIKGNSSSEDFIYNFQKGDKYYSTITDSICFNKAIGFYDEAIKSDPNFALAYARRAIIRSWAIHASYIKKENVDDNIQKCREDIDMALSINKELTEIQVAHGFYNYYCVRDYKSAFANFKMASDRDPSNWKYTYYQALVLRRNGDWDKSLELMDRVFRSDPQDPLTLTNIGVSYVTAHEYDLALKCQDKAIDIMPQWSPPYNNKIETLWLRDGNTIEARQVMKEAIHKTGNNFLRKRILVDYYDKNFKEALELADNTDSSDFKLQGEKFLLYAGIHGCLNHPDLAKGYYQSAVRFYEEKVLKESENAFYNSSLGIAYAGIQNRVRAVEAGLRAVKLAEKNHLEKLDRQLDLARIYVMVGDYEYGLKQIEELIKKPSRISLNFLSLDPVWQPIINRPDFQALCKKHDLSINIADRLK